MTLNEACFFGGGALVILSGLTFAVTRKQPTAAGVLFCVGAVMFMASIVGTIWQLAQGRGGLLG